MLVAHNVLRSCGDLLEGRVDSFEAACENGEHSNTDEAIFSRVTTYFIKLPFDITWPESFY